MSTVKFSKLILTSCLTVGIFFSAASCATTKIPPKEEIIFVDRFDRVIDFKTELIPNLLILFLDENSARSIERYYWIKDLESKNLGVLFGHHYLHKARAPHGMQHPFFKIVYVKNIPIHSKATHFLLFSDGKETRLQHGLPNPESLLRLALGGPFNENRLFTTLGSENVVLQPHKNLCGAASVEMVLQRQGVLVETSTIQEFFEPGPGNNSISMLQIKAFCDLLGIPSNGFHGDLSDLKSLKSPVILHVDHNHFVVLSKLYANGALILDPAFGRQYWPRKRLLERWQSRAFFKIGVPPVVHPHGQCR